MTYPAGTPALLRAKLVLAACAVATAALVARQPGSDLVITGVRLLDARSGRYTNTAGLLVRGGRIAAVLPPGTAAPAAAERLDLPGTTVAPGLGDLTARAVPGGLVDADFHYLMSLAHGVTMLRTIGVPVSWGAAQRDRAEKGTLVSPRLWIAGPLLDQAGGRFHARRVVDAASARRAVSDVAVSADWVAVGEGTSADLVKAVVAAAAATGAQVSAKPGEASINELARAGVALVDRLGIPGRRASELRAVLQSRSDYPRDDPAGVEDLGWSLVTDAEIQAAVQLLRARKSAMLPLLGSFAGTLHQKDLAGDAALPLLPAAWRDPLLARAQPPQWPGRERAAKAAAIRARFVASASRAGIDIGTGVDPESPGYSVPGAGIHRELSLLVAAGLTPAEAIRAATLSCARILGPRAGSGELRAGAAADFFVVEGDPLARVEDLRRIRLVVRSGEPFDPKDLVAQARRAVR